MRRGRKEVRNLARRRDEALERGGENGRKMPNHILNELSEEPRLKESGDQAVERKRGDGKLERRPKKGKERKR